MIDYPRIECVLGHVASYKFCEINDNISETVQDRDIVAMEGWYEIVCGLSNGTITRNLEWPWRSLLLFETFL